MRLLNIKTGKLEYIMDDRSVFGKYAILSHTWGDDEVTFEEFGLETSATKEGFLKILGASEQARLRHIDYLWCDTCCIDKRSSAELSEAINSMYRWYYEAKVCFVYLSDLDATQPLPLPTATALEYSLKWCRWFSRGWTLQELIAPRNVVFYDRMWTRVTTKSEIAPLLSQITDIDEEILLERDKLQNVSVAKRMSFAASRETTRLEDQAYSLLGIFDVNMPLLYGEGSRAFKRLQEEIIKTWTRVDHSILAWHRRSEGLLADSPSLFPARFTQTQEMIRTYQFPSKRNIISWSLPQNETFELANKGLRINLYAGRPTFAWTEHGDFLTEDEDVLMVVLNCSFGDRKDELLAMFLRGRPSVISSRCLDLNEQDRYDHLIYDFLPQCGSVNPAELSNFSVKTLTIAREAYYNWPEEAKIQLEWLHSRLKMTHVVAGTWNGKILTLSWPKASNRNHHGVVAFIDTTQLDRPERFLHIFANVNRRTRPSLHLALTRSAEYPGTHTKMVQKGAEVHIVFEKKIAVSAAVRNVIVDGEITWITTFFDPAESNIHLVKMMYDASEPSFLSMECLNFVSN